MFRVALKRQHSTITGAPLVSCDYLQTITRQMAKPNIQGGTGCMAITMQIFMAMVGDWANKWRYFFNIRFDIKKYRMGSRTYSGTSGMAINISRQSKIVVPVPRASIEVFCLSTLAYVGALIP